MESPCLPVSAPNHQKLGHTTTQEEAHFLLVSKGVSSASVCRRVCRQSKSVRSRQLKQGKTPAVARVSYGSGGET